MAVCALKSCYAPRAVADACQAVRCVTNAPHSARIVRNVDVLSGRVAIYLIGIVALARVWIDDIAVQTSARAVLLAIPPN